MLRDWRLGVAAIFVVGTFLLLRLEPKAHGYVEVPHSLGQVVNLSSNIVLMRITAVDRKDNRIIYAKVRDIKGVHRQEVIRHNVARSGFEPREWQTVMNWAEVGKEALFLHNGSASETCIGMYWYQAYGNPNDTSDGAWWGVSHGEPFLLRSFAGKVDKLTSAITEMLAGKEVIVPCMVDGNKEDLKAARARIQRLRASLKLNDYNPKRDFVGWGGEDFRRLSGMPGFTHISALTRVDPDSQSISVLDFTGDGKPDLCLGGAGRVALLQNSGESLSETSLPGTTGCRAAVWADYNGDGTPDLLLATPTGPKLFTNLGKGEFREDSHLLPKEPGYNLTCAAWIDQNGDGRPDILLGNGWHGLRLYRNKGKSTSEPTLALGAWHYIGPFDNSGRRGFTTAYPPEKGIDLTKKVAGKGGEQVGWKEGKFPDGQVNSLALFGNNNDAVVYLHREIRCRTAMKLPLSLGSDDGLVVWLNGKNILSQNVDRACAPDQARVTLDLKPGKNDLLLKVTQGNGDWAFYFNPLDKTTPAITWDFADVSAEVGLGEKGVGGSEKGDTLTICDIDGDGKLDFVYGAGAGIIVRNMGSKFVEVKDSGLRFETGKVGPVFADFNGDGRADLFVPQQSGGKLFRNEGKFQFTDVTTSSGIGALTARMTSAAWGDVDNDGRLDLVIGCLRRPNCFVHNRGDGTFADSSSRLGLNQKVFNTQAVGLVDLNGDGVLDMIFNNEGQDACVLLGNPETLAKHTPVTLQLLARTGVTGSRVFLRDKAGKLVGSHQVSGGDGRGGQAPPIARFALTPGTYRVEWLFSTGEKRGQELVVASSHVKGVLDEKMPKVE
jgi:hypothetical protein